jgi:hypothetical protein
MTGRSGMANSRRAPSVRVFVFLCFCVFVFLLRVVVGLLWHSRCLPLQLSRSKGSSKKDASFGMLRIYRAFVARGLSGLTAKLSNLPRLFLLSPCYHW